MNEDFHNKKDHFLRAIQLVHPRVPHDRRFAFGWALNLDEKTIPLNTRAAARKFVARLSR